MFCLALFGAATTYAMVHQMAVDDCPTLAADPIRWERLITLWQKGEATVLIRHAWDCDPNESPECVNGNETLTDFGRQQAIQVGSGFRRSLSRDFEVSHSYLHRTHETAMLAFGNSRQDDAITKPCRQNFQAYLNSQPKNGNRVFVTHSSCINAVKNAKGERMLGFNVSKKAHFGIAAFFERGQTGEQQLLGCVWPAQWAQVPAQRYEYRSLVAQKVSDYFTEWR